MTEAWYWLAKARKAAGRNRVTPVRRYPKGHPKAGEFMPGASGSRLHADAKRHAAAERAARVDFDETDHLTVHDSLEDASRALKGIEDAMAGLEKARRSIQSDYALEKIDEAMGVLDEAWSETDEEIRNVEEARKEHGVIHPLMLPKWKDRSSEHDEEYAKLGGKLSPAGPYSPRKRPVPTRAKS